MGHNSQAVHRAYAKHAEVTVPSLADWEKDWRENPQRSGQPKLLLVDFRSPLAVIRCYLTRLKRRTRNYSKSRENPANSILFFIVIKCGGELVSATQ